MKVLDYEFIHYNNLDFSVVSFCKKVISIEIANNIAPFAGARFAKVPGYFLTGAVISSTIVTSARIVLNTQTKLFENEIISSKTEYFYGEIHGIQETYYESGYIKSNQTFEFGKPKTQLLRFDLLGNRIYQP